MTGLVMSPLLKNLNFMCGGCTVLTNVGIFDTSGVTSAKNAHLNNFALTTLPSFVWTANIDFEDYLKGTTLTTPSYDNLLGGIDANGLNNVNLNGGGSKYTAAPSAGGVARDAIIARGGTVLDAGEV